MVYSYESTKWFSLNMRLMPKELKGNVEHAPPLSVARERVRDSWKLLKQSIYSSLHVKNKSYSDDNCFKNVEYEGGENSLQHIDLKLRGEQDFTFDNVVDENVRSFLSDSNNCDDIGELLEKYRYELFAFNRLKNKLHNGDIASEFSEMSSISELSSSSGDSNDDTQTIISRSTDADLQICSNMSFKDLNQCSPSLVSSHNESLSTSSSTLSAQISPTHQNTSKLQHKLGDDPNLPPPERATAVLKPLPSVMKPYYIPDISNFDDNDLNNAMARASSVSNRNNSLGKDMLVNKVSGGSTEGSMKKAVLSVSSKSLKNIELDNENERTFKPIEPYNISTINVEWKVESTMFHSDTTVVTPPQFTSTKKKNQVSLSQPDHVSGRYLVDKKYLHDIPRSIYDSDITKPFDVGYQQDSSVPLKPLNISQSTMAKYPHIFASYLNFQQNPFHSLPNLTTRTDTCEEQSTMNSRSSADKSSLGRSVSHCVIKSEDHSVTSNYLSGRGVFLDNDSGKSNEKSLNRITMIDENYFVIYPEMSSGSIICGNPPCSKEHIPTEAKHPKFTSCPSCYICYCSRTCRHCHWPAHKETCLVGFVNFYVHTFFRRCEKDIYINGYLRKLAHSAYQIFGRGCLTITFKSPSDIQYDAVSPGADLSTQPTYKEFKKVMGENKSYRHLHMLCQNIKDYDPDQEFVLDIFVYIGNLNPRENIHTSVVRSARISVLKSLNPDYGDSILSYGIRTFSLPTSFHSDGETDVETRRYYCKEIAFGLKRYGVHLKSEYPEAYEKLYRYIDEEVLFTPIILYGKRNDRNYKCILYSGEMKKSREVCGEGVFV